MAYIILPKVMQVLNLLRRRKRSTHQKTSTPRIIYTNLLYKSFSLKVLPQFCLNLPIQAQNSYFGGINFFISSKLIKVSVNFISFQILWKNTARHVRYHLVA